MIRPEDIHWFACEARKEAVLVNVTFPRSTVESISQRHNAEFRALWRPENPMPSLVRLTTSQLKRLSSAAEELSRAPRIPFEIERFLLNLLHLVREDAVPAAAAPSTPAWIRGACIAIKKQENFVRGVSAIVEHANLSPEHVAREMRRYLKKTPTEIVNDARFDYAVNQLLMTDRSIYDIALDCGFASLPYFYRQFKLRTGLSPKKYRSKQRLL